MQMNLENGDKAPVESCARYSPEEVRRHDSAEDCWLVIAGKVYNVTSWVPSHPGGRLICLQAGRDSTYLFDSYHPLYVRKLLSKYYIGELEGCEGDGVQYTEPFGEAFYTTVKQRVESYFEKFKIDARVHPHMFVKSIAIILGVIFCYYTTFYRQQHFVLSLLSALWMGFFIAEIGLSIMHDANHGAYSRFPGLGYIMGASLDLVGASSFMWKHQHVVGHHSFTNVHNYDPDIRVKDPDIRRVFDKQPLHDYHSYQHLYLGVLYGLLALKSIFIDDFIAYFSGSIGPVTVPKMTTLDWSVFWLGKGVYFTYMLVIPILYSCHSIPTSLLLYVVSQLVTGWMLAFLFQVAHVVEEAEFIDGDSVSTISCGWAALQVKTTANFSIKSLLWTHLSGGLNYQIEHHLFPAVCHLHYPRIQPIVESTCKEFGVPYSHFPNIWTALKAHFLYLKKVGNNMELRPLLSNNGLQCNQMKSKNSLYMGWKLPVAPSPLKVVCMKQVMDQIRKMSDEEIEEALVGVKDKLAAMRARNEGKKLYKPTEYRKLQIRFSRLISVKRDRDLERGILPQDSRTIRRAWRKSLLVGDVEDESHLSDD